MAPFFLNFAEITRCIMKKGEAQLGEQPYCEMRTEGRGFKSMPPFFSKSKIFPGVIFDFNSH